MHRAANSFVHTLDNTVQELQTQRKPRLIPGLSRIAAFASLVAVVALYATGCTGANPRFGSTEQSAKKETPQSGETADLSKESAEERKEDDVPVPPSVRESIVTGSRDFKTEKNAALSSNDNARLMREISRLMSVPYEFGGTSGEGIDCSAYTQAVYRNALKKDLPRTAREQFKVGSPIDFTELKFGDLIFFNTTGESASHVGIYLGDDLFAHASVTFGVTISSLESSYYKTRYEGAKRIIE